MINDDRTASSGGMGEAKRPAGASVDYFVVKPGTLKAARDIAADRHMNSVHSAVREGGLTAAIAAYEGQDSPSLVVVEIEEDGEAALRQLDALAETCLSTTRLIVIGPTDSVEFYKSLVDRGVSDYLVQPVATGKLIAAIEALIMPKNAKARGRVIAVIGATGGCGASTIAHNVAFKLANMFNAHTILADFDLHFGSVGLAFDLRAPQGLNQAVQAVERLDEVLLERLLARHGANLKLLAGSAALAVADGHDQAPYERILDIAATIATFVVVDLPHEWSNVARRVLHEADEIILTSPPTLAGLRNARHMFAAIRAMRPNDADPRLVLNPTDMRKRAEVDAAFFEKTLNCAPSARIAFEPAVFSSSANEGKIICEAFPSSAPVAAFEHLAKLVYGQRESAKSRSMLARLRHLLKR